MRRIAVLVLAVAAAMIGSAAAQAVETNANLALIAANPGFQSRVQVAMEMTAQSVYSEATGAPQYTKRHAYAIQILGSFYDIRPVALAVVANATVAAEASFASGGTFGIPDVDIASALSAAFNALAAF